MRDLVALFKYSSVTPVHVPQSKKAADNELVSPLGEEGISRRLRERGDGKGRKLLFQVFHSGGLKMGTNSGVVYERTRTQHFCFSGMVHPYSLNWSLCGL
ncbi:hypothetical protein Trydic_g4362 [Trypoxylus dichotomus]